MLRGRNTAGWERCWIPAQAGMTGEHRSLAINSRISSTQITQLVCHSERSEESKLLPAETLPEPEGYGKITLLGS